jgi:hypothetical protein
MKNYYINDVEDYLKSKLFKPEIINPYLITKSNMEFDSKYKFLDEEIQSSRKIKFLENQQFIKTKVDLKNKLYDFYFINDQITDQSNFLKNTYNSHIKLGFTEKIIYGLTDLPYCEEYGKPENLDTWWNECINSAKLIYNQYKTPIICLSGGVDSELVLLSFIESNTPFEAISMIYKDGDTILNLDEVFRVKKLSNKFNFKLHTLEINIIKDLIDRRYKDYFIDNHYETYFLLSALYTQNLIVEECHRLGGVPVMGGDQIELKFDQNGVMSIGEQCSYFGIGTLPWAKLKNIDVIYNFFIYTPNQLYSYLSLPELKTAKKISYDLKFNISKKHGSPLLDKTNKKMTGYEFINKHMIEKYNIGYHDLTLENIDSINWQKMPMTQYIHNVKNILNRQKCNDYIMIRITTNEWLSRGFNQHDQNYYNI